MTSRDLPTHPDSSPFESSAPESAAPESSAPSRPNDDEERDPRSRVTRLLDGVGYVVAALVGAGSGAVLTVVHREFAPWGLLAGLAVVAALIAGYRLAFRGRRQAFVAALGVAVATLALSAEGPGGSVLIRADLLGYAWSFGMPIVAAIALTLPWRRRRSARSRAGR